MTQLNKQQQQPQQALVQIKEVVADAHANETLSTLSFVPQVSDSGSLIACRADNPQLSARRIDASWLVEDTWKLDVHYAPLVSLALGAQLDEAAIVEGRDVYLDCAVRAYPAAGNVRWHLNGAELNESPETGVRMSNQSLVLRAVKRTQRGHYTCSAANPVGESFSNAVFLRVQFAPVCASASAHNKPVVRRVHASSPHEPLKVECRVEADPVDNVTFRWAHASPAQGALSDAKPTVAQLTFLEETMFSSPANEPLVSYANFVPRSESDLGSLLCFAQSALGEMRDASTACEFKLVPASAPDTPAVCELVNATAVQLAVSCALGFDGGASQSLRMEVFEARSRKLVASATASAGFGADFSPFFTQTPLAVAEELTAANGLVTQQPSVRRTHERDSSNQQATTASSKQANSADVALLVTDQKLEPATQYLVSVQAVNARGSSKPLSFAASTSSLGASSGNAVSRAWLRDSRRTGK